MRGVKFAAAGLVLLFGVGLLFAYLAAERVTPQRLALYDGQGATLNQRQT